MKVSVLGAGSWGIALSGHLHRAGHQVLLWARDPAKAARLQSEREEKALLPGVRLPDGIEVVGDLESALRGREAIIFVVPSHGMREVATKAAPWISSGQSLVCATKGLEEGTDERMSTVLKKYIKNAGSITVLSGPSHAEEVSRGLPTTVLAANEDLEEAKRVQGMFHWEQFRVYTSADRLGVELAGALKNVIAIAAGISDGLGLGDNSKAAIMTRGLHEMTRLGLAMGAQAPTFAGLAGMGDLIVTCTSRYSRNRALGERLGKGIGVEKALADMVMVAEGVRTARAACHLANQWKVEMPITGEVEQVLFKGKAAKEAARSLMSRSAKNEQEF
ncbi:MAG TPA: NAD(P)H-dependent glycerol-3-phosphate dehydrogenase [bacterium]|nr:NAD(P)H-dependent glycerol-3-phosphate dehydrogenase [bacterium]